VSRYIENKILGIHILIAMYFVYMCPKFVVPMKLWQLKELNSQGFEVILVTSGAVGLGRQRLRYRKLANSRFL